MNLITLNTWGGRCKDDFVRFLKLYSDRVDIFCLQETYKDAENKEHDQDFLREGILDMEKVLEKIFSNHNIRFDSYSLGFYGLNQIVHKKNHCRFLDPTTILEGIRSSNDNQFREKILQYCEVSVGGKDIVIGNFHGHWKRGFGKGDCGERFLQSRNLINFVNSQACPVILCGDFNLDLDTESVCMIEKETGMRNLIRDYQITDTRTRLYPQSKPSRFADYVFVSPEVEVIDFHVMSDVISDHAPLYLEFDVKK